MGGPPGNSRREHLEPNPVARRAEVTLPERSGRPGARTASNDKHPNGSSERDSARRATLRLHPATRRTPRHSVIRIAGRPTSREASFARVGRRPSAIPLVLGGRRHGRLSFRPCGGCPTPHRSIGTHAFGGARTGEKKASRDAAVVPLPKTCVRRTAFFSPVWGVSHTTPQHRNARLRGGPHGRKESLPGRGRRPTRTTRVHRSLVPLGKASGGPGDDTERQRRCQTVNKNDGRAIEQPSRRRGRPRLRRLRD
jgi:hypothetical protein